MAKIFLEKRYKDEFDRDEAIHTALLALKDYEAQKKEGKDPVFDPRKLGIKNADFWVEYNDNLNNENLKK